jgi:predicted membrane channel-forming protein YqfA (hemolysin III family)|tara:strand:- start:9 stop:239 length:231 start_codon:yes stop_codon:yes gene_type:complete
MALSYKVRRRWSLIILVIGLPVYAIVAVSLVAKLPALPKVLEFIMYVALGIGWVFPLKFVFQGIGQADPDSGDDKN